jgi:hypothetical protein
MYLAVIDPKNFLSVVKEAYLVEQLPIIQHLQ